MQDNSPSPVWACRLQCKELLTLDEASFLSVQASPLPDDKIVIYGGEDGHRRPMAEAYVLDLQVCIQGWGSCAGSTHACSRGVYMQALAWQGRVEFAQHVTRLPTVHLPACCCQK